MVPQPGLAHPVFQTGVLAADFALVGVAVVVLEARHWGLEVPRVGADGANDGAAALDEFVQDRVFAELVAFGSSVVP